MSKVNLKKSIIIKLPELEKRFKETPEERKERLKYSKTVSTKIVKSKKVYDRKKLAKVKDLY